MNQLYPAAPDDRTLIVSLHNGDRGALEYLYSRYSSALYGLIKKRISEQPAAEKILQDVFVKIGNNRHLYNEKGGGIFTWLTNITRGAILDYIRANAAGQNELKTTETNDKAFTINLVGCTDINSLKQYFIRLTPAYRVVLDLFFVRGYSYTEMSNLLQVEATEIRKRVAEACKQLKSISENSFSLS